MNSIGKKALVVTLLFSAVGLTASPPTTAQEKKPNIIVIFGDDVGWGDLGSYGGGETRGAPTPQLDRMAAEGVRFSTWYGQASCTAGRASFITGSIPIRSALSQVIAPGDLNHLHAETPTIAEFFKKNGYKTYMLLGQQASWGRPPADTPVPTTVGLRCIPSPSSRR